MKAGRVAARTARGPLHIAVRTRTGVDTACFRSISDRTLAVVYTGRDRWGRWQAVVAWRHERRCLDCAHLLSLGSAHVLAHTPVGGR